MKPSRPALAVALLLAACPDPPPDDPPAFAEARDGLPQGVGLAAWSDGDDLLIVGGTLSSAPGQTFGGPGVVVRVDADGHACKLAEAPATLWWIHGPAAGEWYAVGEGGTIVHRLGDGSLVDESIASDAILYGVWAEADSVVAVGGDPFNTKLGEVWRRDADGNWSLLAGDLPGVAFKIWKDWIVGDGIAYQLDGDTLIERPVPGEPRLLTVRGRAADDVYAVGGFTSPVAMHWDGSGWSEIDVDPRCVGGGLNGVWTDVGEDLWVAGFFGTAARFDGSEWSCAANVLTYEHYHAVWRHAQQSWWVGGNLLDAGGSELSLARTGGAVPDEVLGSCD